MSAYYLAILQGAVMTVGVSLAALLVAVLLGLAGAAAKLSGRPVLKALATGYTTLIRGVPELVLMLLVFYGGTIGLNHLLELAGSEASTGDGKAIESSNCCSLAVQMYSFGTCGYVAPASK